MSKNDPRIIQELEQRTIIQDIHSSVVTTDLELPSMVDSIERFMEMAIPKMDKPPFSNSKWGIRSSKPGQELIVMMKMASILLERINQNYTFSPPVAIFLQEFLKAREETHTHYPCIENFERLNLFAETLHKIVNSVKFKQDIDNHKRSVRKNTSGLSNYIEWLFKNYSKLMVIRLDLGLTKAYRNSHQIGNINSTILKKSLAMLLQHIKHKFPAFCGYAWKLEYGAIKNFHYHLMLFFDGHQLKQDIIIGELIGKYWINEITRNNGTYWNCNAQKSRYQRLGIGIIQHNETDKINNLIETACYLTKADYYVRLNSKLIGRSFGRGAIKRHAIAKNRVGRPRTSCEHK